MKKYLDVLRQTVLMEGLADEEILAILTCMGAVERSYQAGQTVVSAGDEASRVGVILAGQAHILREDYYGNQSIVSELLAGDIFGEVFACAGTRTMPVTVRATKETILLFLDIKKILEPCEKSCPFHMTTITNLLRVVSQKSLLLSRKNEILSKRSTREKLLAYLSTQAQSQSSNSFCIPFNRQELADFLCVDRSAMSAELGRMEKDGLIDFHKNRFVLHQPVVD